MSRSNGIIAALAWIACSGLVATVGCKYQATPSDGEQACATESKACPDGYTCVARGGREERCWMGNGGGNGGGDGGPDAPSSQPVPNPSAGDGGENCKASEKVCGTRCADLQTDSTNCGACGNDCSLMPNVNKASCKAGVCVVDPGGCTPGFAHCSTVATDLCETDVTTPERCGACGTVCPADKPNCSSDGATQTCSATCGGTTPDQCGAKCVSLKKDQQNCGSCGKACALDNAETMCAEGECKVVKCKPGYADCTDAPGCETPLGTSANCGTCGDSCDFAGANSTCTAGKCSTPTCKPGFANCDDSKPDCETALGSATNCTGCGMGCGAQNPVCASAAGTFSCVSDCGATAPNKCEGRCVNFKTDAANCGSCGNACSFPNAGATCVEGKCVQAACKQGFADCAPAAGCETPLGTNVNCGRCGESCGFANATSSCNGSACSMPVCKPGFANCDASNPDCETPIGTATNCKGCGNACTEAAPVCAGSGSTFSCVSDCTASAPTKCGSQCVNTNTDVNNCGGCGKPKCSFPNAAAYCDKGECKQGQCAKGFDDCTAEPGCETPIGTNSNCARCNDACTATNATSSCNGTSCTTPVCNAGWAKCPGQSGCETKLGTVANCTGCGQGCSEPNPVCSGSGSAFSCVSNCTATAPDKCGTQCVNRQTDVNYCGSCTIKCTFANAGASCVGGQCTLGACANGYADCNGNPADGCEVQLGTNNNCNGCGNACTFANGTGSTCNGSACSAPTCNAGWLNCSGPSLDCETDIRTDTNCGGCNRPCLGGTYCDAGICRGEVTVYANPDMTATMYSNGAITDTRFLNIGDRDASGFGGQRPVLTFDLAPHIPVASSIKGAVLFMYAKFCRAGGKVGSYPSDLGQILMEPVSFATSATNASYSAPALGTGVVIVNGPVTQTWVPATVTSMVSAAFARPARQAQFRGVFSVTDYSTGNGWDECQFAPPLTPPAGYPNLTPYLVVSFVTL